jgi:streptogramin lyase
MLEQAVYAGRNHTVSLAVAVAAAAAFAFGAPPAGAAEVEHVALGTTLGTVIAGPDGGAWVRVQRLRGAAIGRVTPDLAFRSAAVEEPLTDEHAALGPDGQAWFTAGSFVDRSDAAGTVTRTQLSEPLGDVMATGPDGTLWSVGDGRLQRVTAQNALTSAPLPLPTCSEPSQPRAMQRASDGAVWVADAICSRLIRIAPDATSQTFTLPGEAAPFALAADNAGGMWFAQVGFPAWLGHIDASGAITRLRVSSPHGAITDIAVNPVTGTPYLAFGDCALGRVSPGPGAVVFVPAPIPVRHLAFAADGSAWLASATRLVKQASGTGPATCDDTPPKVHLSPAFRHSVTLAQLRHGLRITVREPSTVTVTPFYGSGDDGAATLKLLRSAHGGTVIFRVPAARIKRYQRDLKAGRKPEFSLYVEVADRDGNVAPAGGGGRRVTG